MIIRNKSDIYKRIFLCTTLPFGLYVAVTTAFVHGVWAGLAAGLICGLIYGLFMALLLGATNQIFNKNLKTDYGESLMGVHQVQVVIVKKPVNEAYDICSRSLQVLRKCRITQQSEELGILRAQTGMTWKSFGEKILVTVSADDLHSCKITISSKPALGTTLVDYGKNVENLRLIIEAISAEATVEKLDAASNLAAITQGESTDYNE